MGRLLSIALIMLVTACAPQTPEQRFEREIAADENATKLMSALEESFPRDYAQFRTQLIGIMEAGGGSEQVRSATAAKLTSIIAANRNHLVQAPDANLQAIITSQRVAAEALATSEQALCAQFMMGGFVQTGRTAEAVQTAMVNSTVAVLRGAAAGKNSPAGRAVGPPSRADVDAFSSAMRAAGADEETVNAMLGNGLGGLSQAKQCTGGIAMLRGLEAMPDPAATRLFALLVSNG